MNRSIFNIFRARSVTGSMPSKSPSLGEDGRRGILGELISAFRFGAGWLGPLCWAQSGDVTRIIIPIILVIFLKFRHFATLMCTWDEL